MSQRLGGKDCRPNLYRDTSQRPCVGRDRDEAGAQIPCEHNGFIGVPFASLPREGRSLNGGSVKTGDRYRPSDLDSPAAKLCRDTKKPWKAPRLSAEGKPFEPALGEVGSWVRWTSGGVECVGQVWALGARKCAWIVTEAQHCESVPIGDLAPP